MIQEQSKLLDLSFAPLHLTYRSVDKGKARVDSRPLPLRPRPAGPPPPPKKFARAPDGRGCQSEAKSRGIKSEKEAKKVSKEGNVR